MLSYAGETGWKRGSVKGFQLLTSFSTEIVDKWFQKCTNTVIGSDDCFQKWNPRR